MNDEIKQLVKKYTHQIRLTKNDARAVMDAIDFINTNADGAEDRRYFDEMTRRLNRVWKVLNK